jgi:hypothetical protein
MFQFPGFASATYGFSDGYPIARVGCPIRKSSDQSLLAAPQGFSQRATSFIASRRQGIHQMPFIHSPPLQTQTKPGTANIPMPTSPQPGSRKRCLKIDTLTHERRQADRHACGMSSRMISDTTPPPIARSTFRARTRASLPAGAPHDRRSCGCHNQPTVHDVIDQGTRAESPSHHPPKPPFYRANPSGRILLPVPRLAPTRSRHRQAFGKGLW